MYANFISEDTEGAEIWHIYWIFVFYLLLFATSNTLQQPKKHLSSKTPQTPTVLNLTKEITRNKTTIKEQSFQLSTGA